MLSPRRQDCSALLKKTVQETCPFGAGAASASQGAVAGSASSTNMGNSVLVKRNTTGFFREDVVFTSTDPTATSATVALNVDFATRLRANAFLSGATANGSVQISGRDVSGFLGFILVSFGDGSGSGPSLFVDESAFTKISDNSGFVDSNTFEQHALFRTPAAVVPLNAPVRIDLALESDATVRDSGTAAAEFNTLSCHRLPTSRSPHSRTTSAT